MGYPVPVAERPRATNGTHEQPPADTPKVSDYLNPDLETGAPRVILMFSEDHATMMPLLSARTPDLIRVSAMMQTAQTEMNQLLNELAAMRGKVRELFEENLALKRQLGIEPEG